MLFASLALERLPLPWSQLPDALGTWLQNAGGVAAFGVAIVLLARYLQRNPNELTLGSISPSLLAMLPTFKFCIIAGGVGYLGLILIWLGDRMGIPGLANFIPRAANAPKATIGDWIFALCGLLALFVVGCPIGIDLVTRISWSRIWAIARLSWKEAIRGRVVWVFGAMALVFLFADWFVPAKAEDQLRSYVRVVYWSMTPLFLLTAALLGSFSIPNDVKSNSIHTIVTKPVEKFEIVLGRFFGYAGLLSLGMLIVSCLSLVYVVRGVNEEATHESFKARVPLYGHLRFAGTKNENEAENVGREWSLRSYITGPTKFKRDALRQFAVWDFAEIPGHLNTQTEAIVFEFAFDIFRLSKGDEEGRGVHCSFTFVHPSAFNSPDIGRQAQELEPKVDMMRKDLDKQKNALELDFEKKSKGLDGDALQELTRNHEAALKKIRLDVIKNHRIYLQAGEEVTDYHTQGLAIPADEFQALIAESGERKNVDDAKAPALRVFVSVDLAKQAQMVGVAKHDFYLVTSVKPFWQNFLKGVLGMWCTYMLLLGVAVACSTYLSGVISLLFTLILYIAGLNMAFLREIAEGNRQGGGGPIEASIRLSTKMSPVAPLEKTPTVTLVQVADNFFSWWIGRILNLIPDLDRHDLHQYVANGFDIGWFEVLFMDNFLPLAGYLIPWAILAYYLMKYREIANPQ